MTANRIRFVLGTMAFVVLMALFGVWRIDPVGLAEEPSNYLYRILQLFFAEGDWTSEVELNLPLQLARFIAPIVTLASLVILFAEGIWSMVVNSQVRFYKGHTIVIGLSYPAMVLIRDCRAHGLAVVAVDARSDNPHIQECRALRIPVFVGDGLSLPILRRAGAHRARSLISCMNSDDDNIELSLRVQALVEAKRDASEVPLKMILQVRNMQLGSRLESYPKFFDAPQKVEVRFFNLEEQAARELFSDYMPDLYADAMGRTAVHIVVLGYGELGRHVLMSALRQAHYGNDAKLKVTVLDEHIEEARDVFHRQCPATSLAAEVNFVNSELSMEGVRQNASTLLIDDATMFVVCVGGDSDNLSMALALRQMAWTVLIPNAPIFVPLRNSRGLARLVESGSGDPEVPDGLYPFGTVEQLMRVDRLINEHVDVLAMAIHKRYLKFSGSEFVAQPSHRSWSHLPEVFRNYNRTQADHIAVKLRAAGYQLSDKQQTFAFSAEETERLARMEKRRWNAERASLGWQFAAYRSDLARVHPLLKPWSELTSDEREYDLDAVRELPRVMQEEMGSAIARKIYIGVSGHRAHRLVDCLPEVEQAVRAELRQIGETYPGAQFVAMSALADGSDRLVARLAKEVLGADLMVVLPLPYEVYRTSFGHGDVIRNDDSNEEFQRMVGGASVYLELPLRFGGVDIMERDDEEGAQARNKQYALAGAYIVSRAHEMVGIWDGKAGRGIGGTADVLGWRSNGSIPDEYVTAQAFYPPAELCPPRIISVPE